MSNQLPAPSASNTFERIKRSRENDAEFWSARDLAHVLEYSVFRNFLPVIEKAKKACANSGHAIADHFAEMRNMAGIGSGAQRELAANLFRATQTEEKLRRENVHSKDQANRIHSEVGQKVRQTIHELGGTMPENLPGAESIKKVESREKKRLKDEQKKVLQNTPESE